MMEKIRPLREEEYDEHAELVYVSYSHERDLQPGEMLAHRDWWITGIERDPYYEPEQTRVLEIDGRLVASVTCFYRPSYVGGEVVDAGCIGSVCTHPDHRQKGYVRRLLAEAVEWMTAQGWQWSFLYGREEIYGGSGWQMLASYDVIADLRPSCELGQGIMDRRANPERDIGVLCDIYDSFCSELTGPTVRSEEYWRQRVLASTPWAGAPQYRIVERNGTPLGYYNMEGTRVRELAWVQDAQDLLAHIIRRAGGQPVRITGRLPMLEDLLRNVAEMPSQAECFDRPGGLELRETYRGLWRLHPVRNPIVRGLTNTHDLTRFLRERDYVMWPADRA